MLCGNTQYFSKILELVFWKCFGEDIRHLIIGRAILELNLIGFHGLPYEVMLDGNVLRTTMVDGILCHCNCGLVVTHDWSSLSLLLTNIFQDST